MPREYRPATINTSSFHHSEAGIIDAGMLIREKLAISEMLSVQRGVLNPVRVQADTQVLGQMVPAI
jgi:hypothetical protein